MSCQLIPYGSDFLCRSLIAFGRQRIQSVTDTLHQFILVFLLSVRDNLQYIPKDTKISVSPIHGVNQRHNSLCYISILLTLALLSLNGLFV